MRLFDRSLGLMVIGRPGFDKTEPLPGVFDAILSPIATLDRTQDLNATGEPFLEERLRNSACRCLTVHGVRDLDELSR